MTTLAWHFLADTGKLRDGRDCPPIGEKLIHNGTLILCDSGLHASVRAIDALQYAPGVIVCRVECGGSIEHAKDKLVCSERTVLARADSTETLRAFARWCALRVIDKWAAPAIVREYLETGDKSKRAAAWDAARDAAWAAARAAARAAAWDAARDAAWAAARDAAWAAARAAAWDAERAAAWDAAWDAAWAAAWDAQNKKLEEMLSELLGLERAQ